MAINKVVYGANTLIDLTADTVTADTLKTGFTAHDKSGTAITGTLDLAEGSVYQDEDGCVVLNDDDGSGVSYIPLTVSSNGTYTASSSYCYNPVTVNVDNQYYSIYKSLAFRSVIASSAPGVSEWANSLTSINNGQFANQNFSGSFTFNNVKSVSMYGFGSAFLQGNFPPSNFTLSFPNASVIGHGAFAYNFGLRSINGTVCDYIADYAFYRCSNLTSVYFPVLSKVSQYTFYSCSRLTDVSIPSATLISTSAFANCSSLSSINFPEVSIVGSYAFYLCSGLVSVNFPIAETIGNYTFSGCRNLTSVNFPAATTIGSVAFSYCPSLSFVSFPNCTTINNGAFHSCASLTTVSFPVCTSIGVSAFAYCSSLTEASFPSCKIVGGSAFRNCSSLETINFPVCEIISAYAFTYCSSLTSAYAPECETIYASAFYACASLKLISFPKCTSMFAVTFGSCSALESAYFLGSVVPTLNNNPFMSTPLSESSYLGYFGSIFIRQSLLQSFISSSYWNVYSSRFVGLTDEQIAALDAS